MLIFDELKKSDPQLRLVALVVAGGLGVLLAGLWWVQIVSAREYQGHLETQSYRTVRIPAARGKILDRHGRILAENRPRYDLSLYLDDLRRQFAAASSAEYARKTNARAQLFARQEKDLGRPLTRAERKRYALTTAQLEELRAQARCRVASNVVAQLGRLLGQPMALNAADFERNYEKRLVMPYAVLKNLNDVQIARFEENYTGGPEAGLELQSVRVYPLGTTAAHLLGYVRQDDSSAEGEDAYFSYRLPDYRGVVGVEAGFDSLLRGRAGAEAVLVNNLGYRQTANVWSQPEPGRTVVLTIDLDLQQASERSLAAHLGVNARASVVVMDVRTGDVLAMVSSPAMDPNYFVGGLSPEQFQRETAYLNDTNLLVQFNRATQVPLAPGSIFKPFVGLAALENGLNPDEVYHVEPDPGAPSHGCIYIGKRKIADTVPPGPYNFRRAIEQSSNAYFIFNGLRTGIERVIRLAEKFHFGEGVGLPLRQESRGDLPTLAEVRGRNWRDGDSANICFGQGKVAVTPMQMAVAYAAIANGGTVLWPRLVECIEPQDPASGEAVTNYPSALVRDHIGVSQRSLDILREAMLSETEDPAGTGRAAVVGLELRICGKTGTAQVENERGQKTGWNYWFASFAPYENPKYVVVVMVQSENSGSGGTTCAPIAHDVYEAILRSEHAKPPTPSPLARQD